MKIIEIFAVFYFFLSSISNAAEVKNQSSAALTFSPKVETYIRIEQYARSSNTVANYHFYERNGQVICTEMKLCTRYDGCNIKYVKGHYKEHEDIKAEGPINKLEPQLIKTSSGRVGRRTIECLKQIGME